LKKNGSTAKERRNGSRQPNGKVSARTLAPEERLLDGVRSPEDIRKLPKELLPRLAAEVRELMVETVAEHGGHLGAGLGATDLAVALHYVLDTPRDFLVWDVGHQVQAHKILTGRKDAFRRSFRQYKGTSGLANKDEGPYDPFTTGHGGPSISAALGVAVSRRLQRKEGRVVAVIGDASIASGMAFEALNHAGHIDENLVVVLNDNEMSISPTVGALSKYLNRLLSHPLYNHLRKRAEKLIRSVPKVGTKVIHTAKQIEEGVKHLLVPGLIFECLGFRYFGPLDGHNLPELVELLPNILKLKGPLLIHVITKKGKGFAIAERDPERWHASAPFHVATGELKKVSIDRTYTQVFGETIVELAARNPRVTALTGGMTDGTGLGAFAKRFPDRFFDVGISEEHGVTFCAGLAHGGMRPVAAIYSTFLQRGHDQIIHDVALQNLPVMFCLDRAGLVGEDGPTHHGVFDIAYLIKIPGLTVLAPRDGKELADMMAFMVDYTAGPTAVRYPRGAVAEQEYPALGELARRPLEAGRAQILRADADAPVVILAVGSMVGPSLAAAETLSGDGIRSTVVNVRFLKPFDEDLFVKLGQSARVVATVEEGCLIGGFGASVLEVFSRRGVNPGKVLCLGIPDQFIEHGPRKVLLDNVGLSPEKIAQSIHEALPSGSGAPSASPAGRRRKIFLSA
jgi:1-deoxy-D-xylulose-5-phosphate synthase